MARSLCLEWEEAHVPVLFLFWGARVKSLGTPLPALGLLQHGYERFVCEHVCYKESQLEAIAAPWKALLSFQGPAIPVASGLGGVTGYLSSILAGNVPNLFQHLCCTSFLRAHACRCLAQPEGLEWRRSPAASSDGCGGCKPHPLEQHFVQCWVTGLWEECFSVWSSPSRASHDPWRDLKYVRESNEMGSVYRVVFFNAAFRDTEINVFDVSLD